MQLLVACSGFASGSASVDRGIHIPKVKGGGTNFSFFFLVAVGVVLQFPTSESSRNCFSFRVVGLLETAADFGYRKNISLDSADLGYQKILLEYRKYSNIERYDPLNAADLGYKKYCQVALGFARAL